MFTDIRVAVILLNIWSAPEWEVGQHPWTWRWTVADGYCSVFEICENTSPMAGPSSVSKVIMATGRQQSRPTATPTIIKIVRVVLDCFFSSFTVIGLLLYV
jgi:hypothetical protein